MKRQEKANHITVWQFQELTLELRHNPAGATGVLPPHFHEEYQFIVSEFMTGEYSYRKTRHIAPNASLLVIHPGEVHSARGLQDSQPRLPLRTFYVHPALLQRAAGEEGSPARRLPFFAAPVLLDAQTFQPFLRLHRLLEGGASTLEQETAVLYALKRLTLRHADEPPKLTALGKEHRAVQTARDYLDAHCAEKVSLTDLAQMAGLSAFHLCRLFCRDIGLPPHAYQTQQCVQRAKTLLAQGQAIGAVAVETGFADQSHLTRKFKRLVGVTPGNYRARPPATK